MARLVECPWNEFRSVWYVNWGVGIHFLLVSAHAMPVASSDMEATMLPLPGTRRLTLAPTFEPRHLHIFGTNQIS
jgi:hypothetical protein